MVQFSDILYGKIELPDWLLPFVKLPEFLRLRGVRLSNVDSFQFKDFNGPTRWDHSVAVASLALRCAETRAVTEREKVHLVLAALLHDVGTPPFAHTAEYVLEDFDHEVESQRLLGASSDESHPERPVFASQLPRFRFACESLSRSLRMRVDPDEVARLIVGDGELGPLIQGTLDLDNADNVTRSCLHLGLRVNGSVPLRLAEWLGQQKHLPPDLERATEGFVLEWMEYRRLMYQAFFTSSDDELGRQAFLQHLMRRSLDQGLPRPSLIWKTDESLLATMETLQEQSSERMKPSLRELVERYRLMETPAKIAHVAIESEEALRALKHPRAAHWIEQQLYGPGMEAMAIITSRRFGAEAGQGLFPAARGALLIFKLGEGFKRGLLPPEFQAEMPRTDQPRNLLAAVSHALDRRITRWVTERPWLHWTPSRRTSIQTNLDAVGDWSFRLSRNEGLHPYPSTFVWAIPANLMVALGLRGELVVDPFGGTGQTASEAIKYGGSAVSGDSNTVACMIARAKLTYLASHTRDQLRDIGRDDLVGASPADAPAFDLVEKWFHKETLTELCRIQNYIRRRKDETARNLLYACFSSILTLCTSRKGEQHGYFADNCPLPKGRERPVYRDAIETFLSRLRRNIASLERFYSTMQRDGRYPEVELHRARVVQANVLTGSPALYGLSPGSVAGIITSPPYLCMSDYTLGQRLSYQWLEPDALKVDFTKELGARRLRFQPDAAVSQYFEGLKKFAALSRAMLRSGGFLATVLGAPVASRFQNANVFGQFDGILAEAGFEHVWHHERRISWHRNHGYSRLNTERISVHVAR